MSEIFFIPGQKLVHVSHWASQQYQLWKAFCSVQPPHTSAQLECMHLLAAGHLNLVMGTCVLFAHLCSNFDVPEELDLILIENVLTEYMETF